MTSPCGPADPGFLFEVSRRLNQDLHLDRLLEEIRDIALEAVGAEACSLLLWNEDRTLLEFQLAYNRIVPEARDLALAPGQGLAGWISDNRQPFLSNAIEGEPRFRHQIDRQIGFVTRALLGVPIYRGPVVIGVLELHNKTSGGLFDDTDLRLVEALSDQIAVALHNALLFEALKREKLENEALYRISLLLNERLSLPEILETFLDQVKEVIPYQAAAFYLVEEGTLKWFVHRGYPEGTSNQIGLKIGQGAVGWAAKTGEPLVLPDVSQAPYYVVARPQTRSEIALPIKLESKVIGAFNLEADRPDAFRSSDVRMLQAFANQAAISIQRAQLFWDLREKGRLESELRFAREIQKLFLPEANIDIAGYDVAGISLPSREVSGDFYDWIRITDGQLGLMIGDVSGKGAAAALIMATLRASLRAEIRNRYSISEIMAKVNYLLWESTRPERFATLVYGVLDLRRRLLTYANAGHNPPLLCSASGEITRLSEGGLILGPFRDTQYTEGHVHLEPGDVLVMYTDGVTEALSPGGVEFWGERLASCATERRGKPAAAIAQHIV